MSIAPIHAKVVPIHVKVLRGPERAQLMINDYKINDELGSSGEVIDEFLTDQLIIRSSLDFTDETMQKRTVDLGSLVFEVFNAINGNTYRDFIYYRAIPWFPSFSVQALTEDEPIFAARCMPYIFQKTHALQLFDDDPTLQLFRGDSTLPHFRLMLESTMEWLCAEPYDAYISFHLAEFINNMNALMYSPYIEFVDYRGIVWE